jgi:hypothetical protein
MGEEFSAYLHGTHGIYLNISKEIEEILTGLPYDRVAVHFDHEPCLKHHGKLRKIGSSVFKGKRLFWSEVCIDPLDFSELTNTDRWELLINIVRQYFVALMSKTELSEKKKQVLQTKLTSVLDRFWREQTRQGAMVPWEMTMLRRTMYSLQIAAYKASRWRDDRREG